MKRILILAVILACTAGVSADSPYINNAVSGTDASQTLTIGTTQAVRSTVLIINGGANEAFYCLWSEGTTPAACTATTGLQINSGESISETHSPTEPGRGYIAVSIICSAGETATLRVKGK